MKNQDLREGDVFIESANDFAGDCQWSESVCKESPEAYIVHPSDSAVYCLRHYALTLSQIAEVHEPSCSEPLAAHIKGYGRLGG